MPENGAEEGSSIPRAPRTPVRNGVRTAKPTDDTKQNPGAKFAAALCYVGQHGKQAELSRAPRENHIVISAEERAAFAWASPPAPPRMGVKSPALLFAPFVWFAVVGPCVLISWTACEDVVPGLCASGLLLLLLLVLAAVRVKKVKERNESEYDRELDRYVEEYRIFIHRLRSLTLDDVDSMTGTEFESYVARLATHYGYSAEHVGGSGDQGCDLILSGFGERIACQAKRWSDSVDNSAVQEVVAAIRHRACSRAVVITNSYFNKSAKELARSNSVRLIDREKLAVMSADFRDGTRRIQF